MYLNNSGKLRSLDDLNGKEKEKTNLLFHKESQLTTPHSPKEEIINLPKYLFINQIGKSDNR